MKVHKMINIEVDLFEKLSEVENASRLVEELLEQHFIDQGVMNAKEKKIKYKKWKI